MTAENADELSKRLGHGEGNVAFITHDIESVCGHPAETFEDYHLNQENMTKRELLYLKPTIEDLVA